MFDWRELQRWGISEARLPAGSIVQFRQPSVWDQYQVVHRRRGALVALQSALIAGLVVQRAQAAPDRGRAARRSVSNRTRISPAA